MTALTTTQFDLNAASLAVSHVTLDVRDLYRVSRFYRDIIGLEVHSASSQAITLGAGAPFLTLRSRPDALPRDPRLPGLFHTAFLLPRRSDLGAWLRHAGASGARLYGASDHDVSEALYLDDPEGNGVEIYVDRPVETWRGSDGHLHMSSRRLDLRALPHGADWTGAPEGTRIGHVHLQTTDIRAAESFWTDLGMEVTARYPGGRFFGAGGYHHQIATNVWASRGQGPKPAGMAGLADVTLETADPSPRLLTAPSGVAVRLDPKGH